MNKQDLDEIDETVENALYVVRVVRTRKQVIKKSQCEVKLSMITSNFTIQKSRQKPNLMNLRECNKTIKWIEQATYFDLVLEKVAVA